MNLNQPKGFGFGLGMALLLTGVALINVLLVSCKASLNPLTPNVGLVNPAAGQAGSIAFTGLMYNGNSQISFVSVSNYPAGVTIYFSNYSYDATANSGQGALVDESTSTNSAATSNWPGLGPTTWANLSTTISESTITYVTGPGGLNALNEVVIGTGNLPNVLQGGTASGGLTLNHNGAGHKILAWTGGPVTLGQPISTAGVTFVAAIIFGPDSWTTKGSIPQYNFWDSYLPPGLDVTTSTDLSSDWNNAGLAGDNNASDQNDNAVLSTCVTNLQSIINPINWSVDGNEGKTKVGLPNLVVSPCGNGVGYQNLP